MRPRRCPRHPQRAYTPPRTNRTRGNAPRIPEAVQARQIGPQRLQRPPSRRRGRCTRQTADPTESAKTPQDESPAPKTYPCTRPNRGQPTSGDPAQVQTPHPPPAHPDPAKQSESPTPARRGENYPAQQSAQSPTGAPPDRYSQHAHRQYRHEYAHATAARAEAPQPPEPHPRRNRQAPAPAVPRAAE